jgi:hypothetical protein
MMETKQELGRQRPHPVNALNLTGRSLGFKSPRAYQFLLSYFVAFVLPSSSRHGLADFWQTLENSNR